MNKQEVLRQYKTATDAELEFRFHPTKKMFRQLLEMKGEKSISQTINIIAPKNKIITLFFVDGEKRSAEYMQKIPVWSKATNMYKVSVASEKPIAKFGANSAKLARIKLRISIVHPDFKEWRIDFTFVKTVTNIQRDLKRERSKMLFKISPDRLDLAPWDSKLELEIEHTGDKSKLTEDEIGRVVDFMLNQMDPQHSKTTARKVILRTIAKMMLTPKKVNNFLKQGELRNLYNKVWELNKSEYFKTVYPNIKDYFLLDKADGVRTLGLLKDSKFIALNDELHEYDAGSVNALFDAEYIKETKTYYVFDVMFIDGENIMNMPTSERIKHIPAIINATGSNVLAKMIIPLTDNFSTEIKKTWGMKHDYEVDGLIFTPKHEPYAMKSWKWKPLSHMSIDFLVKKAPEFLIGLYPFEKKEGYQLMFLFSTIHRSLYKKLNMRPVQGYKKIFPYQSMTRSFPIQFAPSDNPHAFIFYTKKNIADKICEFRYENGWKFMRVREDRQADLEAGGYYGNSFGVAEYTWQNYKVPLLFDDLVLTNAEFMDKGYFREEKLSMYKPVTAFHSYVKRKLLTPYTGSKWLVDLAAGKGQDMFRVSDAKIKNALFIDNDPQALSELVSRKNDFQRGIKRMNTRVFTKRTDLTDDYKKIVDSMLQTSVPVGEIDVVICNFAIHYLIGTPRNVRNLINLITSILKPGGVFIFTAFDGSTVFNKLAESDWMSYEESTLKYAIKKKYTSSTFAPTGQAIDVLLPFSGGKYYQEYLVNFDHIINEFKVKNFKVVKSHSFSTCLPIYKKDTGRTLSAADVEFTSMYRYCVLKLLKRGGAARSTLNTTTPVRGAKTHDIKVSDVDIVLIEGYVKRDICIPSADIVVGDTVQFRDVAALVTSVRKYDNARNAGHQVNINDTYGVIVVGFELQL